MLFNPSLIGEESPGIHEVLMYSIQKSDMDLRKTLYSHVVMSGGSTLFKGFGERLLAEVTKLAPKNTKIKVRAAVRAGAPARTCAHGNGLGHGPETPTHRLCPKRLVERCYISDN